MDILNDILSQKTLAIDLGSQDLDHGSWIIQICIWFDGSFPFTFHASGKFPEISRNYLPGVIFTIFKVFPDYLDSKDTILLLTSNDELD